MQNAGCGMREVAVWGIGNPRRGAAPMNRERVACATALVLGAECPAAAPVFVLLRRGKPLWRGQQVSGRGKAPGTSRGMAASNSSCQKRDIESYRGKSCFVASKSCLESCYFPKVSCIIVFNRGKNKESFFSVGSLNRRKQRTPSRPKSAGSNFERVRRRGLAALPIPPTQPT